MENRYYGEGDIIESATGYLVKVGEPVFDDKVTANEYGVAYILVGGNYAIENDTQYLVTLEVNGESKMYRELWMSGNTETANEVALSDYTFTMDEGTIGGLTEDDVVIARFEPVEVYTSDAFRAAVEKVAPSGGGSGGGVLVVHEVEDVETGVRTLDKTWQEIHDTFPNVKIESDSGVLICVACVYENEGSYNIIAFDGDAKLPYTTISADGYPFIE